MPGVVGEVNTGTAVVGTTHGDDGFGVLGQAEANTGVVGDSKRGHGVVGVAHGNNGFGVLGRATANVGVVGESMGGQGVHGRGPTGGFFEGGADAGVHAIGLGAGPAIRAERGGNNLAALLDGNVTVTKTLAAYDVQITGMDCAEFFDTVSSTQIEPGTVMVISDDGRLVESQKAYDSRVAGIVSGAGHLPTGITLGNDSRRNGTVPLALVGKVFCKVDASFAPVRVGDLLTTSPSEGHAMKVSNAVEALGAVIGKALAPLQEGQGLVPVLVALQ